MSIKGALDISRRALFAQTQAIRVIGNNIANVNTPGYSRRRAELVSLQPGEISENAQGSGVEVRKIVRIADKFLNQELAARGNDRARASIRDEFLSRVETPFAVDDPEGKISTNLTKFFGAIEDLKTSPGDSALRLQIIEVGTQLTQSINSAMSVVSDLQRETDNRIAVTVDDINRLSSQIAELNRQLRSGENEVQENLTVRDKRDEVVRQLNEKVKVTTTETSDGSILVSLQSGFGLVIGDKSNALEFTRGPSFASVAGFPPGMDGEALGHVVYNYGTNSVRSDIDLTGIVAAGGGEIAGLLTLRGVQSSTDTTPYDAIGDFPAIGARIESLARDLLSRFNLAYLGPDENVPAAGYQASSFDLLGGQPLAYGLFAATGALDAPPNGIPDDLTNNVAAGGQASYARSIRFAISDPNRIAAALDLDPVDGSTSYATGDGSNLDRISAAANASVTYSLGTFSQTTTIRTLFDSTVTFVGGITSRATSDLAVQKDREAQVQEVQSALSGVSLDEEFALLINFQRAFQASARMVRVSDDLFGEVLNLLG